MKKKINILLGFIFILGGFSLFAQTADVKKDTRGTLVFNSFPDEVNVYIDNKQAGTTPLEIKLEKGIKLVKFTKPGYKTEWKQVECNENWEKKVKVELSPVTSSVIIRSEPIGVGVELNGEFKGETPLVLKNLPIGKYRALLSKQGFVSKEVSWIVDSARPQIIEKNLSSNIGTVKIKSIPYDANVYIDGKPRGKTPFEADMTEGHYKLKIMKSGYAPYEYMFILKRNETEQIKATLEELPGSIKIESNPSNCLVFLNGRQYENTPVKIDNLLPGNYKLKVERKGFDPVYKKVTVYKGQENSVVIDLKNNTGGIGLIVNPPGVSIYINGRFRGVTKPDEKNPQISKLFTVSNLPAGSYTIQCTHKRAQPTTKTMVVNVNKGKITRSEKAINMWISDHILTLSSGQRYEGRLRYKSDKIISFEIEPGVIQDYQKHEVRNLVKMSVKED